MCSPMVAAGLSVEDMKSQSRGGMCCHDDSVGETAQIDPARSVFPKGTGRAELLTKILPQNLDMRQSLFRANVNLEDLVV